MVQGCDAQRKSSSLKKRNTAAAALGCRPPGSTRPQAPHPKASSCFVGTTKWQNDSGQKLESDETGPEWCLALGKGLQLQEPQLSPERKRKQPQTDSLSHVCLTAWAGHRGQVRVGRGRRGCRGPWAGNQHRGPSVQTPRLPGSPVPPPSIPSHPLCRSLYRPRQQCVFKTAVILSLLLSRTLWNG